MRDAQKNLGNKKQISKWFFSGSAKKNLPARQETQEPQVRVGSLDREHPLEEGVATHSRILSWSIPWTEEPGRLQSTGLQRIGHD